MNSLVASPVGTYFLQVAEAAKGKGHFCLLNTQQDSLKGHFSPTF